MKKIIASVALVSVMCVLAPQAGAQSLLDKAKKAVGDKVEGAVSAGLGKIMGGKQQSQNQASLNVDSQGFPRTARGVFDKGDDPYQIYVDALNEGTFKGYYYDAYKELTDMGGDESSFIFKSISEVVAAYPGIPTARQMAITSERRASAEALRNYDKGVSIYQSIDMVEQANNVRVASSKASPGLSDNGSAMQKAVFDGAKKLGKSPEQLTETEIMAILEGMDTSSLSAVASTATNGAEFDSVTDRISDILDRSMSSNVTIQKVERSLNQIVPEMNAAWNDSEARQQVYDNEADIDKRILSYWDQTHKEDYPEFWKDGRREQNDIIDKFNIQQAVKWRKVIQGELEPYIAMLQEIGAADAELESTVTDRSLLDYALARQQLNSAFMMIYSVVINVTQYAYAVPLVSNTVEDGYGQ